MVRSGDYDGILTMAKRLAGEGSQLLDLCCAIVGEDEQAYMNSVLEKIAIRVPAPILVDSTEAVVIEEALKRIPGKPIINSINLEDGEKRTSLVSPCPAVTALRSSHSPSTSRAWRSPPTARWPSPTASTIWPSTNTACVLRTSSSTRSPAHLHGPGGLSFRGHRNSRSGAPHQA